MNYDTTNTIVYLACRLAEVETELKKASDSKEYWYKSWKEASDKVADLQLIINNSAPAKEGE